MLELSSPRKHKINLADYNSQQDVDNRMVIADFSPTDLEVLEEILFSPLKISLKKLTKNFDIEESELQTILQKLAKTGLLEISGDSITVDKDMRKYFEFQIQRLSPTFNPDMEYFQGLIRLLPINVITSWYSVPRTSNNIFESIIEKNFSTPQIFQRYLIELNFPDPVVNSIVQDVLSSTEEIASCDLITKYNLTPRNFEEIMILLEYSAVCAIRFVKQDDHWQQIVTPYHEWAGYLRFLRDTQTPLIDKPVTRNKPTDFAFVEEMTAVLQSLSKGKLAPIGSEYILEKLCLVKLIERTSDSLIVSETAKEWLSLTAENKALFLYRHPANKILSAPAEMSIERTIRRSEKSIKRVLHGDWVFFDEFLKGVYVPLSEETTVMLKKTGKVWKYTIPVYSDTEISFIHATIFEWLYECGIVATGTLDGRDCFSVTPFGRFFFAD